LIDQIFNRVVLNLWFYAGRVRESINYVLASMMSTNSSTSSASNGTTTPFAAVSNAPVGAANVTTTTSTASAAASNSSTASAAITAPVKQKMSEKLRLYFKFLYNDYREVFIETIADARARPGRAAMYLSILGGLGYCVATNPTARSYISEITKLDTELSFIHKNVRNPRAERYLHGLRKMQMAGVIRYQSLGIFTFVWRDNEDKGNGIYHSSCKYIKPRWTEIFTERFIDVGFLGKWWLLLDNMKDYDVNPEEWNDDEDTKEIETSVSIGYLLRPAIVA